MAQGPLAKVKATTAVEVCRNFDLKEEARPFLRGGQSPREFLEALLANKKYAPAIDFLAHALPPREAVWWGCLCVQRVGTSKLSAAEAAACKAAAAWVLDPTEENRLKAKAPAEAATLSSPAGGLATAATWTGGSLAPPMSNPNPKVPPPPPVPPGPFLPAKAVAGAILLAAVKGDPTRIADTQHSFVELGVGVAEGRYVWPEVPKRRASGEWSRGS
jgi:uncharacterized protein DUF6931